MRWGDKALRTLIVMAGAALALALPLTAFANGAWS